MSELVILVRQEVGVEVLVDVKDLSVPIVEKGVKPKIPTTTCIDILPKHIT